MSAEPKTMSDTIKDQVQTKSAAAEPFEEPKGPTSAEGLFTYQSNPVIQDRVPGDEQVGPEGQAPVNPAQDSSPEEDRKALVSMVKAKMGKPLYKKLAEIDQQAAMEEALALSVMQYRQAKHSSDLSNEDLAAILEEASGKTPRTKKASRDVLSGLTQHLDSIASSLEAAGVKDAALWVDAAANSIDEYRGTREA